MYENQNLKVSVQLFSWAKIKKSAASQRCVLEINNIEVTEDRTQPGGFYEVRLTVGL